MKVGKWDMIPLTVRKRKGPKEDIKVRSLVAIQNNKRIVLHRVEKTRADGSTEVFIIKASAADLDTDH